jgi:hypothetical protein
VFGGCAIEDDQTIFDVGQKGILLSFVPAGNLVNEQYGTPGE